MNFQHIFRYYIHRSSSFWNFWKVKERNYLDCDLLFHCIPLIKIPNDRVEKVHFFGLKVYEREAGFIDYICPFEKYFSNSIVLSLVLCTNERSPGTQFKNTELHHSFYTNVRLYCVGRRIKNAVKHGWPWNSGVGEVLLSTATSASPRHNHHSFFHTACTVNCMYFNSRKQIQRWKSRCLLSSSSDVLVFGAHQSTLNNQGKEILQ